MRELVPWDQEGGQRPFVVQEGQEGHLVNVSTTFPPPAVQLWALAGTEWHRLWVPGCLWALGIQTEADTGSPRGLNNQQAVSVRSPPRLRSFPIPRTFSRGHERGF